MNHSWHSLSIPQARCLSVGPLLHSLVVFNRFTQFKLIKLIEREANLLVFSARGHPVDLSHLFPVDGCSAMSIDVSLIILFMADIVVVTVILTQQLR